VERRRPSVCRGAVSTEAVAASNYPFTSVQACTHSE
jgi:hypothetical protein